MYYQSCQWLFVVLENIAAHRSKVKGHQTENIFLRNRGSQTNPTFCSCMHVWYCVGCLYVCGTEINVTKNIWCNLSSDSEFRRLYAVHFREPFLFALSYTKQETSCVSMTCYLKGPTQSEMIANKSGISGIE